ARVGFAAGAAEGEGAAQGRGEGFALPGPGAPERRQRAAGERAPHVPDAHPQSGDGGGAGGEEVGRVGTRGTGAGREDAERREVHRVVGGLDVPERQVERSEQVCGHGLASQRRRDGSAVNRPRPITVKYDPATYSRSEEHTSELQSREKLVCRL